MRQTAWENGWKAVNITQKNHVFSALHDFFIKKVFCPFYNSTFSVLIGFSFLWFHDLLYV